MGVHRAAGPPPAPPSRARFEPVAEPSPPPEPAPHVEILFPFSEQRILIPKAAEYTPRLKVEHWPTAASGPGVMIALDGAGPRRWRGKPLTLRELGPEGTGVEPGPHWLFAWASDASGAIVRAKPNTRAPMAAVRFWVGERDPDRKPTPRVILAAPPPTINGAAAADALVVDFLAAPERLGVADGRVRVRLTGPGVALSTELERWQPIRVRDLPSGDYDVEASLLDHDGRPLDGPSATARRTITVNRELEPASAESP